MSRRAEDCKVVGLRRSGCEQQILGRALEQARQPRRSLIDVAATAPACDVHRRRVAEFTGRGRQPSHPLGNLRVCRGRRRIVQVD